MFRITKSPSSGSLLQCLANNYMNDSFVSVDMDKVGVHHHHHHHVPKGLGMFSFPWSSRWSWSLHLFLGRPMFLRPFGLCCSACFGSLFVSILCTRCSHLSWYCFSSFTTRSVLWRHILTMCSSLYMKACYILCIGWIIKCLTLLALNVTIGDISVKYVGSPLSSVIFYPPPTKHVRWAHEIP